MSPDTPKRAAHFGAQVVDLGSVTFTDKLLATVPRKIVQRYRVLPVVDDVDTLTVAIADPSDLATIDSLSDILDRQVNLVVADESQIEAFIGRLYDSGKEG